MSSNSYWTVYSRTTTMMHDIEQQVGKAALERAFKLYYARWKFRHPSTADLEQALIEGTGRPDVVKRAFAQQVYGVRKVDDRVVEFDSTERLPLPGLVEWKGKPVELTGKHVDKAVEDVRAKWSKAHPKAKEGEGPFPYVTRVVVRRDGAAVPQTVLVRFDDGSSRTIRWDAKEGDRWGRWRLVTRSRATSVELDPENRIFLDRDKIDDSRTREADGSASRRWTADVAAALQSAYALMVTL